MIKQPKTSNVNKNFAPNPATYKGGYDNYNTSTNGKNPYTGAVPKSISAHQIQDSVAGPSYGPAYKTDAGDWWEPANWGGKQPQEYNDHIAEEQKAGRARWERIEAEKAAARNRKPVRKQYELPKVADDYDRMGDMDYSYNNDAPTQNSSAGDLSATYDRNTSGLLSGLLGDELSPDGARGVSDLQRSLSADAKSEIEQESQARNSQTGVENNQLEQEGLAQQAQLYGQINDRAQSQMGLAQQMQSSRMKDQMAQMQAYATKFGSMNFRNADTARGNMFDTMFKNNLFDSPNGGSPQ